MIGLVAAVCLLSCSQVVAATAAAERIKVEPVPELMRRATRGYSQDRDKFIQALGNIPKEKVREFKVDQFLLEEFVRKPSADPRLRNAALTSLVNIASNTDTKLKRRILADLVRLLENAKESEIVRAKVAGLFHRIVNAEGLGDDRRAIDSLERIVKGNAPSVMKIPALLTLGRIGAASSLDVIRPLITSKNESVKKAALEAFSEYLSRIGQGLAPTQKPVLCRILDQLILDKDLAPGGRQLAILSAARMTCKRTLESIEKLLRTYKIKTIDDEELILVAIEALAIYRDPKTAKTLVQVYKDFAKKDDVAIRTSVCKALGEFYQPLANTYSGEAAVQLITGFLAGVLYEEKNPRVVEAACYSLGGLSISRRFSRKNAIEALIDALADEDKGVRTTCKESLELVSRHLVVPRKNEKKAQFQQRWTKWYKKNAHRIPR